MEIKAKASTVLDELVLHSYGLTVESITLTTGVTSILVTFSLSNDDRELLIISPEGQLAAGDYNIDIKYSGRLDGIIGFYASTVDGDTYVLPTLTTALMFKTTIPCISKLAS